jgi:hypothetical protein
VEITSTYGNGLEPLIGYDDVVLGYDPYRGVFVGLDPIRLHHGGATSNASSFLEAAGLERTDDAPSVVLLRQTRIFPNGEFQAFFRPQLLDEYLLNHAAVHAGGHNLTQSRAEPLPNGWLSRPIGSSPDDDHAETLVLKRTTERRRVSARLTKKALDFVNGSGAVRRLSPEELKAALQRMEQNGWLGEEFVFEREKRVLRDAGRADLADRVDWVSKRTVTEGYDIKSFDPTTGAPRFIEVKTAERMRRWFEISANEWNKAQQLREKYFIYRVTNVRSSRDLKIVGNPSALYLEGKIQLRQSGWLMAIEI